MKTVSRFIKIVIFSAIPSFLSYAANSSLLFNKLIEWNILSTNIKIDLIQDYCLWAGIITSTLFLSVNLFLAQNKLDRVIEERNLLMKMCKDILAGGLSKVFSVSQVDFDVRIFIPKHPIRYKILDFLHIDQYKRTFIIKNIDILADQGTTKDLQFEVFPNPQGLVGKCYCDKQIYYDDNLEQTNRTEYHLSQNQISRTNPLKWSICCPIYGENSNVVAIIALDGKSRITINPKRERDLSDQLIAFSRLLYDSVPQLFRR